MDFVYTPFAPWLLVKERKDLSIGMDLIMPEGTKSPYPFSIVEVEKLYEPKEPGGRQCPFEIGALLVVESKMICHAKLAGVDYLMVTENAVQGKVVAVGA